MDDRAEMRDIAAQLRGHLTRLRADGVAAVPMAAARPDALAVIRTELGDCTRCKLHPTRKHILFGGGNPAADLVFVGEAPGANEDEQGEPFVGEAGQLLTKMIVAMG